MIRGWHTNLNLNDSALLAIALTGANTVRVFVRQSAAADVELAKTLAAACIPLGMRLIPAITVSDKTTLAAWWAVTAKAWKGQPGFYGYDVANELNVPAEELHALQQPIVDAIRLVDAATTIILQGPSASIPDVWGSLIPCNGENLLYSPHMYYPHTTTHQGLSGFPAPVSYPSSTGYNSIGYLRNLLGRVQAKGLPAFIGEFSCVRWAPGRSAYNWIRDCLQVMEEMNFGWIYLAWQMYQGWDCTLAEGIDQTTALSISPLPPHGQTDTKSLLELKMRA